MILFSSFSHVWIFLLFAYLGLISGIVYFACLSFIKVLKKVLLKDNFSNKQIKENIKKPKKSFIKKAKKIAVLYKERLKKRKYYFSKKRFIKFKTFFKKFFKVFNVSSRFVLNIVFNALKIFVLFFVVFISYILNLHYNLGVLRIGFILVWLIFFFIAKSFCKTLAFYLLNFYNYFKGKIINHKKL